MKTTSVSKVQFASLNDRRNYFSYGIVSLSYYGHQLLPKVRETKRSFPKIHHVIEREKNNLLKLENEVVARDERLRILGWIYSQPVTYYNLNTNKKFTANNNHSTGFIATRDYILGTRWL